VNLYAKKPERQPSENGNYDSREDAPYAINPPIASGAPESSGLVGIYKLVLSHEVSPDLRDAITEKHTPRGGAFNQTLTVEVFVDTKKFYICDDAPFYISSDVAAIISAFNETFELSQFGNADINHAADYSIAADCVLGREGSK
jgi:hypothetical protein